MATASLMHKAGLPMLWDDLEGWDGEGGGSGVQDGDHMYTYDWFIWMYSKIHHNIVK